LSELGKLRHPKKKKPQVTELGRGEEKNALVREIKESGVRRAPSNGSLSGRKGARSQ